MTVEAVEIHPRANLDSEVAIPGSKSCTARALVMAGLTIGESTLIDPADCDDTDHMVNGLTGLGIEIAKKDKNLVVRGKAFASPAEALYLGNSGTAMRFLTAASATLNGLVTLDGNARMRERPIEHLITALRQWGVTVEAPTGCPPVTLRSNGVFGGKIQVDGTASSQYLSGLLMAAPRAHRTVSVQIRGDLVSKPYIDLTLAMMQQRGTTVWHEHYKMFTIPENQRYRPGLYRIEADASGASYFLAAPAIAGGRVRVMNLTFGSLQGDAQFAKVLEKMGCHVKQGPDWIEVESGTSLNGIDIDLNAMPDMAQTLAVVALFAEGPTTIRNVANLRIKETDRIEATASELRKLGAEVEEWEDGLRITPGETRPAEIDTYDDHRMAMSFAMAGLKIPGVVIRDPKCVSKTFPDFFERFDTLW